VISRVVMTQREQIAALKALGYPWLAVAAHYLKLVLLIVLVGVAIGTIGGVWLGIGMTRMYTQFFHFPIFGFHLEASVVVTAFLVTGGAAVLGTVGSVRRAVKLPPAEAMRPAPPASYRPTRLERLGLRRLLSPAMRMVLRQLERRPLRAVVGCLGIALAAAILVLGNFVEDAIEFAIEFEFQAVQRHDLVVTFVGPRSARAAAEVRQLPGVERCEPFRAVAARLRSGHRTRRVGITGLEADAELFRLVDMEERVVPLPPEGLVISAKLAEILHVAPGGEITVEVLEERRPVRVVRVVDLLADFSGMSAYMDVRALNRMMGQDPGVLNGAYVAADADRIDELYRTLKGMPQVAGVAAKSAVLQSFRETIGETLLQFKRVNVVFAIIIACGVVYNAARISLAERSRELATLRVIGFTRGEISMIQLGELAVLVIVAVPIGLGMGYGLAAFASLAFNTELFRIPLVVNASTYAFATTVVVLAATGSGLLVRRILDRLDLVAVLKSKE